MPQQNQMLMYTIAVKDAIEAGKKNLLLIPALPFKMLVVAGSVFPVMIFSKWGNLSRQIFEEYFWIIFGLAIFSVLWNIAWRSLHSAAWKIWALENVVDAHRLYEIAERRGMIYNQENWLGKLEYKTAEQAERLAALELRLFQARQMEDLGLTGKPLEEIQFKFNIKRQILLVVPFLAAGLLAYMISGSIFPFLLPFGAFIVFILLRALYLSEKPPVLILTPQHLQISKQTPIPWKSIKVLRVERRTEGRAQKNYLVVASDYGTIEHDISEVGNSAAEVEESLYEYWVWGKKQP